MRFAGTCEKLCDLDVAALVEWAEGVPLDEWPKVAGSMRGPDWRWVDDIFGLREKEILWQFPGGTSCLHYFSMIFPSHKIAAHRDEQAAGWVARVHVPILTNPQAMIVMGDDSYHLAVGAAYRVNTLMEHSVRNDGDTPRLHWMFDVNAPPARL